MTGDHLGDHPSAPFGTTQGTTTRRTPENPTNTGRDHLGDHPRPPQPGEGVEGGPCKGTTPTPHLRRLSQTLTDAHHLRYCYPMATRWSEDDKANALDQLRNGDTLREVHDALGIPVNTMARWARAAGIDVVARRLDKTREATAASLASREARRIARIDALERLADLAIAAEIEMVTDGELRDVVGCRTRAIHDAELLAGRATSRTSSVTALDEEIATLAEALGGNAPAEQMADA